MPLVNNLTCRSNLIHSLLYKNILNKYATVQFSRNINSDTKIPEVDVTFSNG